MSMTSAPSLKVDTSVKGILWLTLPISMAKLIPELNYLINAAFLGRLGNVELAMAGLTGVYYLVFTAIGYGLHNALLSLLSRRAGEDNRQEIFTTLWHGLVLATILAALFVLLTYAFIFPLLEGVGIAPQSIRMAGDFLNIRIWGLFFLFALQMQNAFLISLQQTKYLMLIALVESLANIVLDYGLIFGHWGLPELGFNGAAYASVVSELVGMITVFWVIYSLQIKSKYQIVPVFKVYFSKLLSILKLGFPLMSQLAISTGSWWVFFILISRHFSYDEQAISQTMRNLFGLGGVFSWAFGAAANTVISNLIGQGRVSEMFGVVRKLCYISVIGMSCFVLLLNLFPYSFFELFGQSAEFSIKGVGALRVVSSAMIILCIGVIWLNAVVATGQTKIVFWIEFLGILLYLLYVWTSIEVMNWSIEAAWMSEWVYWVTLFSLSYVYLKRGNWREHLSLKL